MKNVILALCLLGSFPAFNQTYQNTKVYIILEIDVHDSVTYGQYREQVEPMIAAYGEKYIVRSGAKFFDNNPASTIISPERQWYPDRIILLEFPLRQQFQQFVTAPEYGKIATLRASSASTKSIKLLKNYLLMGQVEKNDIRGFQLSRQTRMLYRPKEKIGIAQLPDCFLRRNIG